MQSTRANKGHILSFLFFIFLSYYTTLVFVNFWDIDRRRWNISNKAEKNTDEKWMKVAQQIHSLQSYSANHFPSAE